MSENPIQKFVSWYSEIRDANVLKHPTAVHLSTVDAAGAPQGRVVDLRSVDEAGFVFTTYLDSPKGQAIKATPAVALTFWWDCLGRQVRVVGVAEKLSPSEDDTLFHESPREAQLVRWASRQGQVISDLAQLREKLAALRLSYDEQEIPRPKYWGGYRVRATSIEFFNIEPDRLHQRVVYLATADGWQEQRLEP